MTGDAVTRRLGRWRLGLGAFGVAMLCLAAVVFVGDVPVARYPGVAAWLIGALVVHDGIIALAVTAVGLLLRRARWRPITTAIVGGAAVVGAIMAIVVVPILVKDAIGTANPTVLPLDYVGNLLWFELGVVLVTVVAVVATVVTRRVKSRHR